MSYATGPWYISWGRESSPGTEATPNVWLGIVKEFPPKEKREIRRYRHAGKRDFHIQTEGKYEFPFSFEYYPQDGKFLTMCLGTVTDSGSGPYTHTIDPADQLPTFTLEAALPSINFVRRYLGCKVDKMTISCVEGDDLKVRVDCSAMDVKKYTSRTSVAEVTTKPYSFAKVSSITFGGNSIGSVKSFSWTFSNNLKYDHAYHLGSAKPSFLPEGGRENDLVVEFHPTDTSWWDNWLSDPQTAFDVEIVFTRGANDTLTLKLNDCLIEEPDFALPEEPVYLQKLVLKPKTCQIVVVDSEASYP